MNKKTRLVIFTLAFVIYCLEILEIIELLSPTLVLYIVKAILFSVMVIVFYRFEKEQGKKLFN